MILIQFFRHLLSNFLNMTWNQEFKQHFFRISLSYLTNFSIFANRFRKILKIKI